MITRDGRSKDSALRLFVIAASFIVVLAGLGSAAQLILPFLVSVFFAVITLPLTRWLQGKRVPKLLAVICTVLIAVAVLAVTVLVVSQSVNEFTSAAPGYQIRLQEWVVSTDAWVQGFGIQTGEWEALELINPGALFDLVGGTLGAVAALLSNTFLVVLTAVFILLEAGDFSKKIRAAFGDQEQHFLRLEMMTRQVQKYLVIKTLVSLATGFTAGVWVALLGLDFPLLWGLLAFIFNYIPNLGSIMAGVPPVLLALLQFGSGWAIVVAFGYLIINLVLGNFLEPALMGRRLGLSTLVVFLSLIFWGWLWGPIGMLLSVPLTMVVKIAFENTEDFHWVAVMLDANPASTPPMPPRAGRQSMF